MKVKRSENFTTQDAFNYLLDLQANIRDCMKENHLSYSDIAKMCLTSRQDVYKKINGSNPRIRSLRDICLAIHNCISLKD